LTLSDSAHPHPTTHPTPPKPKRKKILETSRIDHKDRLERKKDSKQAAPQQNPLF